MTPTPPALTPADAITTVRTFIEASGRKDLEGMKQCLTTETLEKGEFHGDAPELERYEVKGAVPEGNGFIVAVELYPKSPPEGQPPMLVMPFVLIPEKGAFRIDMGASMNKMFGGDLDQLLKQLAEGMKTAMEGVTTVLAEGMKSAFSPPPEMQKKPKKKRQTPAK